MSGEQGHFLIGLCIIEPDPNGAGNCETRAIGRILYLIYRTFTEARRGTVGQTPLRVVLGKDV